MVLNSTNLKDYTAYITTYLLSPEEQTRLKNGEELRDKLPYAINDTRQQRGGMLGDGADYVDVYTYSQWYCKDEGGRIIKTANDLGDGCKGLSYKIEHKVYKIAADCMSSGGGLHGPDMPTNPGPPLTPPGPGGSGDGIPGTGTNLDSSPNNPPTKPEDQVHDPGNGSIITTPLLQIDKSKFPYIQLKEILESNPDHSPTKPNIKPVLEELIINAQAPINYETGYRFLKKPNEEYSNEALQAATNAHNTIPSKVGGDVYGVSHTYKLYPMFSWDDIFVLFNVYLHGSPHVKNDAIIILVAKECLTCTTTKIYALKIQDWTKFRAKMQADLNNPQTIGFTDEEKLNFANKTFEKKFKNETNYEKMFLQNFADSGISLFKANEDLTNWSQLTLSDAPLSPVSQTPCN